MGERVEPEHRHRWQAVLYHGRWVEFCVRGCGANRRARIDKYGKPVAL